jgi:hypothetical protein
MRTDLRRKMHISQFHMRIAHITADPTTLADGLSCRVSRQGTCLIAIQKTNRKSARVSCGAALAPVLTGDVRFLLRSMRAFGE